MVGASVLGLGGGYVGFLLTPTNVTDTQRFLYPAMGGVGGVIIGLGIGFLGIYMWHLFRAPYRQRNEARKLVKQQRIPSDSEVDDAIQLLEEETLVTRNNDGEERPYSFAKILLAIADQLSIGFRLISFVDKIHKGLDLDAGEGWFIPSGGITHLIGVLIQNNLVERRSEAYERMVPDYVITIASPPQHSEKGTETKCYLSPFGSRVIRQLRQQSTVHKENSAIPDMLKSPRPPELQISYQKHEFGMDNGVPIITVWAEYRPTGLGPMRVETIELRLVGECVRPMDWKVLEMSQDLWYTSDNKFTVPDGMSPGKHGVTLAAFANGEWWGSHPFTIAFPEVNSR